MKKNRKIGQAIAAHKKAVAEFERNSVEVIVGIAEAITKTFKKGGTVYICGNGGSAADAQHIAAELVGRFDFTESRCPPSPSPPTLRF